MSLDVLPDEQNTINQFNCSLSSNDGIKNMPGDSLYRNKIINSDKVLLIYTVFSLLAQCRYISQYTKTMTSSFNLVTNSVTNVNCHNM